MGPRNCVRNFWGTAGSSIVSHDMQGLKDEAKEYAGNENPLKSSTHESDLMF